MRKLALMTLIASLTMISSANAGIFKKKKNPVSSSGSCISTDGVYQIQFEETKSVNKVNELVFDYQTVLNIKNAKTGETLTSVSKDYEFDKNLNFMFMDGPTKKYMSLKIENPDRSIKTINATCKSMITENLPSPTATRVKSKYFLKISKSPFPAGTESYSSLWVVDGEFFTGVPENYLERGVPKHVCFFSRYKLKSFYGPGDYNVKLPMTQFIIGDHFSFSAQSENYWYVVSCSKQISEAPPLSWMTDVVHWVKTDNYSEAEIIKTLKAGFPGMIEVK